MSDNCVICGHDKVFHKSYNGLIPCVEYKCTCKLFTPGDQMPTDPKPNLQSFFMEVEKRLEDDAKAKGYSEHGPKDNPLMDFMTKFFPDHSLGEIVYKAVRYDSQKDLKDLTKIAAWAALIWLTEKKNEKV